MRRIIADSSPLIILARSGLLDVLRQVVGDVVVPVTVSNECTHDNRKPGAIAIIRAQVDGQIGVLDDVNPALLGQVPTLDAGEISVLALALELHQPVRMNERLGRQVAAVHRITVVGSAGVLLAAKQQGLIPAVAPLLRQWQGMGYFLAPALLQAVLARANETARDLL